MFYKNFLKCICVALTLVFSTSLIANDWLYTVRPNDDASSLGNKYLINPYRIDEVLRYNELSNNQQLQPGLVLKFPLNMLKFGPARVQVISVQGEVDYLHNNQSEPLSTAHSIRLGDRIITKEQASATLRFADKSELLLGSNSELVFDVLTRWGRTGMVDSRMRLLKGTVEGRVETLQGPGAHFEVHTPSAVATVRGTEFRVRVDKGNTSVSYNEVSEGKVKVENTVSDQLVNQGFGLVSEAGKVASEPVELLSAPTLLEPQAQFPALPVTLSWQSDPEAVTYRYELFKGDDVSQQIATGTLADTSLSMQTLEAGDYTVRMRKVAANGLEGLNTTHKFTLNGGPLAATGLTVKDENLVGDIIEFHWSSIGNTETYHLELAKDSEFKEKIMEEATSAQTFELSKTMAPGQYYWRVRGENEYGKGNYSKVETLQLVLPDPPTVAPIEDVVLGQTANIVWSSVANASSYQWQMARDKGFTDLVKTSANTDHQIQLNDLETGDYYFRVAAVGPHNSERYSQTTSFQVYEKTNGKNPFMLSSLLLILLAL
ncbi:MAG: FecR domain-containing protein [Gammaproteobacteria bacterium]|nr:FecR domain-containing protein [Gammaproteobacteria bacterium]